MAWCGVVEPRTLHECRIALGQSQGRRSRRGSVRLPSRTGRGMPGGGRRRRSCSQERVRWRRIATTTNSFRYRCWRSWSGCTSRRCGRRRDGRLPVTYDNKTTFRRLRARATPAAAQLFRRSYFGRHVRRADRRQPLTWASVPRTTMRRFACFGRERGVSQAQFAAMIGAAGKAVVYQWEARKRCPSPVFWCRIRDLDSALSEVAEKAGPFSRAV